MLKADGSLKSVTEVPWEAPRGVQVHEAGGGLEMKEARGRQLAVLRSEKVIVPGSEGRVELPAARVTWFDPGQKRYRTIEAGARILDVTPSDNPVDEGGVQREQHQPEGQVRACPARRGFGRIVRVVGHGG